MQDLIKFGQQKKLLPSQREIADKLDVSRNAVQRALRHLQAEGQVRVRERTGIAVNQKIDLDMLGMQSMTAELGQQDVRIRYLGTTQVVASNKLQAFFHSHLNKVLKIERIHCNGMIPLSYEATYFNPKRFAKLEAVDFTDCSLYQLLREQYQVKPSYGQEDISCVLANCELSRILQIKKKEPVYQVASFNYQENGEPLEYTEQFLVGSYFKYHFNADNIFDYQEDKNAI